MESYNVLMDTSVDESTKKEILKLAQAHTDIQSVRHLYSSPVGYQYNIFIIICVDGNLSTFQSHKIADSLEKEIKKLDRIHDVIVHVNPV